MKRWALALLRCPRCAGSFASSDEAALRCAACGTTIPIAGGVPRFVGHAGDALSRRTQDSFGYEWTHFSDWTASGATNFADYFAGVPLESLRHATVLDAGCGMGRHARQIAAWARHVVATDFSHAIDAAARNLRDLDNVQCLQADLRALPVGDAQFDFVYSLGVLHHIEDTTGVLRQLVEKTRPGGRVRIYLYWKRHGLAGLVLGGVTLVRVVTTRLPLRSLKALSWVVSVGLAVGVVVPYRLLARAGVRIGAGWPLAVYAKYPFTVLYNDQFDRFSAPLEKRYDADEVRRLMEAAGLVDVRIFDRYGWIADGIRPARPPAP